MAVLLSFLGGPMLRTVLVAAVTLRLLRRGEKWMAMLLVAAVGGAGLVNTAIKKLVARTRPATSLDSGYSFPSGHTTGTLTFVEIGAYLLWRSTGQRLPALVLAVAGIPITGLVGLSRIWLLAHHRGDVIGSYVLGTAWVALVLRLLGRPPHRPFRRGA